MIILTVKLNVT